MDIIEYFDLLLKLGMALHVLNVRLKDTDNKEQAEQLREIVNELQKILDEAERILTLIQTPDEQVKEYGESNYLKIIQDNLRGQLSKLEKFERKFRDSKVFNQIDKILRERLRSFLYYKMDSLRGAVWRITHSDLIVDNNQIFIIQKYRLPGRLIKYKKAKVPAFSDIDKQRDLLSKLQKCSQSLESLS